MRKWEKSIEKIEKREEKIVSFEILAEDLNFLEHNLLERIFSMDPHDLNFRGEYQGQDAPENLIEIPDIIFGSGRSSGIQHCPDHVFADFGRMTAAMESEIGKKVFIDSGFRSYGRQAYLFLKYLAEDNNFSILETAGWVTLPGYSEHGNPVYTALDLSTGEGINGFSDGQTPEEFEAQPEFKWLIKNAYKFNFRLSYPKNNSFGINYEPWHWRWEEKENGED